jgi:hypothetical protein
MSADYLAELQRRQEMQFAKLRQPQNEAIPASMQILATQQAIKRTAYLIRTEKRRRLRRTAA